MFAKKVCPRVTLGGVGLLFIGTAMMIACSQPQQTTKAVLLGSEPTEAQVSKERSAPPVAMTIMDGNRPENRRAP
jgi:hypothetical protein